MKEYLMEHSERELHDGWIPRSFLEKRSSAKSAFDTTLKAHGADTMMLMQVNFHRLRVSHVRSTSTSR